MYLAGTTLCEDHPAAVAWQAREKAPARGRQEGSCHFAAAPVILPAACWKPRCSKVIRVFVEMTRGFGSHRSCIAACLTEMDELQRLVARCCPALKNLLTSCQPCKPWTFCSRINCHKPKIASHVAVAGMPWIGRESICRALERLRVLWNYFCLCSRASRPTKAGASCHVISASCDQF